MSPLRFTLLSDGSSDQVLVPVLDWLLRRHQATGPIRGRWADLRWLPHPPERLEDRLRVAVDLNPCDLLFVHRDAEGMLPSMRVAEIHKALASHPDWKLPVVCVIPVRMQEAWLLFDEPSIRRAAGYPKGRHPLALPRLRGLEELPDPKSLLYELLREASGLQGRRRSRFSVQAGAHRVVELIEDFSPLLELRAFQALDSDIKSMVMANGWAS